MGLKSDVTAIGLIKTMSIPLVCVIECIGCLYKSQHYSYKKPATLCKKIWHIAPWLWLIRLRAPSVVPAHWYATFPAFWTKQRKKQRGLGFFHLWYWVRQEEERKLEGRDGTGRQSCFRRSEQNRRCHTICTGLVKENRRLQKSSLTISASVI